MVIKMDLEALRNNYNRINQYAQRLANNPSEEDQAIIDAVSPQLALLKGSLEQRRPVVSSGQMEELEILSNDVNSLSQKIETVRAQINLDPNRSNELSPAFISTLPEAPSENQIAVHFTWIEKEIEKCTEDLQSPIAGDRLKSLEGIEARLEKIRKFVDLGEGYSDQKINFSNRIDKIEDDLSFLKMKEFWPKLESYFSENPPTDPLDPRLQSQIISFLGNNSPRIPELSPEQREIFKNTNDLYNLYRYKNENEIFLNNLENQFQELSSIPLHTSSFQETQETEGKLKGAYQKIQEYRDSSIDFLSKFIPMDSPERNRLYFQLIRKFEESAVPKQNRYNEMLKEIGSEPITDDNFKEMKESVASLEKDKLEKGTFNYEIFEKEQQLLKLARENFKRSDDTVSYWEKALPQSEELSKAILKSETSREIVDRLSLLYDFSRFKYVEEHNFFDELNPPTHFDQSKSKELFFDLLMNYFKTDYSSDLPSPLIGKYLDLREGVHSNMEQLIDSVADFTPIQTISREIDSLSFGNEEITHEQSQALNVQAQALSKKLQNRIGFISEVDSLPYKEELMEELLKLEGKINQKINQINQIDFSYFARRANILERTQLSSDILQHDSQLNTYKEENGKILNELNTLKGKTKDESLLNAIERLEKNLNDNLNEIFVNSMIKKREYHLENLKETFIRLRDSQISINVLLSDNEYVALLAGLKELKVILEKEFEMNENFRSQLSPLINKTNALESEVREFLARFTPPIEFNP